MLEYLLEKLARARARLYTFVLARAFYRFGKGSIIIPPLRFHNLRCIQIGIDVVVHGYTWMQAEGGEASRAYPRIVIHDHAHIGMNATITAAKLIVIGEHALLGRNVHISDHGHDYTDITKPIVQQDLRKATEVRIGAESWIGQNAVILPGASIGKHCIIGANSVVNTAIPDFCVAAGIPAKVINRYNPQTSAWESVARHE